MQGIKYLTRGPINSQLFNLAMPVMATSFIQMAYSLTDKVSGGLSASRPLPRESTARKITPEFRQQKDFLSCFLRVQTAGILNKLVYLRRFREEKSK